MITTGKNIRVSNEVHQSIIDHLSDAIKIGKWVETAIKEKIEKETLKDSPLPQREFERLTTKEAYPLHPF
jgi:hypothetical protein